MHMYGYMPLTQEGEARPAALSTAAAVDPDLIWAGSTTASNIGIHSVIIVHRGAGKPHDKGLMRI